MLRCVVVSTWLSMVWASPGEDLCPAYEDNPGGSATCHANSGPVPLTMYCAGPCSGVSSAVPCNGYFTLPTGTDMTCDGCCMPGYQCCGDSPLSGAFQNTHCCASDEKCCHMGCARTGEVCCSDDVCMADQTCCQGMQCCDAGEVCLLEPFLCCSESNVCAGACCGEGETCVGNTCTKVEPCVYLGVNLTELGSKFRRNDTYVSAGDPSDYVSFNPCGVLLYAEKTLGCWAGSVACYDNALSVGIDPYTPYFDDDGHICLSASAATSDGTLFYINITFTCGSENITWDSNDTGYHSIVKYRTPLKAVCDQSPSSSNKDKYLKIGAYAGAGVVVFSIAVFVVLRVFVLKKPAYDEIN